jgi:hypothetical protein
VPYTPTRLLRALLVAPLVLLGSCKSEVTELPGAVGTIPIFNPSKYKDYSSAYTSDEISNPMKFSSYTWHLETEASAEDVAAFYMAQWPDAGREDDEEEIRIRNPPFPEDENEPLGESIFITIKLAREDGKTQFSIDEDVFANRRR